MPASALNGENSNIATMPMLNIWTPPPDMYSMKNCIGSCLAGAMAKSHARLAFKASYALALSLIVLVDTALA